MYAFPVLSLARLMYVCLRERRPGCFVKPMRDGDEAGVLFFGGTRCG